MKILFICDEFTLDLTGKTLNWTEQNSWFSDEFILSSTFPFDIEFDEDDYFLQYKNYNDFNLKTKFDGVLQRVDGKLTPSYLQIEQAKTKLSGVIRDGIELFPSWDQSINTFDLGVIDVADMVSHAESVVTKTYPQVNYNFPMIECHALYKDQPHFEEHFRGYYNFRTPESGFLRNIESTEYNVAANNNIVYPMPYYLAILKAGVESAGYTLHGDVLNDEHFSKAIMPIRKIEYFNQRPEAIEIVLGHADIVETNNWKDRLYSYEINLTAHTRYKITGELLVKSMAFRLFLNNTLIYSIGRKKSGHQFELIIEPNEQTILRYEAIFRWPWFPGYQDVFEGLIVPQEIYNENGDLVSVVADFNKVNLSEQLPELSFGDFVKIFKSMKNYDFDLKHGKEIWMNIIDNELTHDDAIDLTQFEKQYPVRKYEEKGSFLLKYNNSSEEYPSVETFITLDETLTGFDLKSTDDTKEVTINCSVLPVIFTGIFGEATGPHLTAKMIDDDSSKAALVLFSGLKDGWNYTSSVEELQTPVLVERFLKKFIYFYIKHVRFVFDLDGHPSDFFMLNKKSKIFIYNNFHIIEELNRVVKSNREEIELTSRTF